MENPQGIETVTFMSTLQFVMDLITVMIEVHLTFSWEDSLVVLGFAEAWKVQGWKSQQ